MDKDNWLRKQCTVTWTLDKMNTEFTLAQCDEQRVSSVELPNNIAQPLVQKSHATGSWVSKRSMNSSVNLLNCFTCAIVEIPITTSPVSLSHSTNLRPQ
jgi:hypothetical protein